MKFYPYSMKSGSVKRLCEALDVKRIYREGPAIQVDTLVNWGCARLRRTVGAERILNSFEGVAKAHNKLKTFKALDGHVGIPEWTESRVEANRWLAEGLWVYARTNLTGNSGDGIVLLEPYDTILKDIAPLYTKRVNVDQEYRVHVFNGKAIFLQRKARKRAVPDAEVNWKIRNHENGFIFAHKDVVVPGIAIQSSLHAVDRHGLDFGAVDVAVGKDGKPYVFEVNTAPGIEGTCLDVYVEAFKELM